MLNLYSAQIEHLSIHRVGNKSRNENYFLSKDPFTIDDELMPLLKEYFFKPFRDKEENYYQFKHETDLEFHELYQMIRKGFNNPSELHQISKHITKYLFEQSKHQHIKSGEVYVTYLENVLVDNQKVEAIGIFKSELKHDFLQFDNDQDNLKPRLEQGVHLNKLDKGALILNVEKETGYKVLSIDSNKYDTKYWLEEFLGIDFFADENFYTKKYLKFCENFAKDVVRPAEDKQQEMMFMNKAVNHFASNEDFEETKFLNEVLDNPELHPEFKNYKTDKATKYNIEDLSSFPISNTAVTSARKKMKNVINLDTNVQIKMDFVHSETAEKYIEKGWDEDRQMYYYLVYFNKEER
ncbi:nucleoid-associated protein [Flavobacterium sp. CS20]|uniref:nucleoid-associated protein n=1 Tax=Flavobacterium sp. CS20 TaxID=2775246 RepID=UPI001B39E0EB|nr:nucleoid-associated protein [Flavobacterium sp. CS20]QTY27486.1 nucleoid-associated protein [Flavobacterium sp. CS20]